MRGTTEEDKTLNTEDRTTDSERKGMQINVLQEFQKTEYSVVIDGLEE